MNPPEFRNNNIKVEPVFVELPAPVPVLTPIDINKCMSKSLNENSYLESFNPDAVLYILQHKNVFNEYLQQNWNEDWITDNHDPFERLETYYKNSKNGNINVKYRKKLGGFGRLFADHSLSLQGLYRPIRGSIAGGYYYDIDFVNCHPVLLEYICKIHDCDCDRLSEYVQKRETIIKEILEDNNKFPNIDRSYIKRMILSILNGGEKLFNNLPVKTKWVRKYRKEIESIHEEMMEDEWYPNITKVQKKIKKEKGDDTEHNLSGSVLNKALCVYEDYFLKAMTDYFTECDIIKDNAVLCFDGVMVPRGEYDLEHHLQKLNDMFPKKYGISLEVKAKEFEKFPNFPEKIPKLIENDFSADNNYYWLDFIDEMTGTVWESLNKLCIAIERKINKVMFYISGSEIYIRKMSEDDPIHIDAKIPKAVFAYKECFKDNYVIVNITLESLLIKHGLLNSLDTYTNITFKPEMEAGVREFNTWIGFKSKLLNEDEIDLLKLEPVFDLLRKVWANSDEEIFKYLLSWFHNAFKKPYIKNKVAIILYSEMQQVGKGLFINEFLIKYIYGKRYAMSVNGLSDIVSTFNRSTMNKLFVNCDELQSINGSMNYHAVFDQLKKIVTDPTITIKIKYVEDITNYPDYMNIIASTNNLNCFKIEQGDSRYCTLECSPCYRGNFKYFDNLVNNVFNQDTANHFFSYCYYLDKYMDVRDLRDIPMTSLKKDMMLNTLSSPRKFLHEIKTIRESDEYEDDFSWRGILKRSETVKASLFYEYYKRYCECDGEKILTRHKFGRDIKSYITKKRSNGFVYMLDTISL